MREWSTITINNHPIPPFPSIPYVTDSRKSSIFYAMFYPISNQQSRDIKGQELLHVIKNRQNWLGLLKMFLSFSPWEIQYLGNRWREYFLVGGFKHFLCSIIEGSLEVKLLTIWTDEKQSRAEAERRERLEERRSEEKESEERRCRCAKR